MDIDGIEVKLMVSTYIDNGNLAVCAVTADTGEPYAKLTVNIDALPPDMAAIDTNNFPGAERFIRENNLGEPTGLMLVSGFCSYPVYKFRKDILDLRKD